MYGIHPSDEHVALFKEKPFQGQTPDQAEVIFCGTDANYSEETSEHKFFERIKDYHRDPIAFWDGNDNKHHPFLLDEYPFNRKKGGVPFHRNFSRLELQAEQHAKRVTFLEILDVPTVGNKSGHENTFFRLLCQGHLKYIDRLIRAGGHKLFFVSIGVLGAIKTIKQTYPLLFSWYADSPPGEHFLKEINGNRIKEIYHFSYPGIHSQIAEIRSDIDSWLSPYAVKFICPNPQPWSEIYQKLEAEWIARGRVGSPPPVPLILNGWMASDNNAKHKRWLDTVRWAEQHDLLHLIPELPYEDQYKS